MAKISPVSIKYTIKAKFSAEGVVEKPDVIGALFGQTEGLLGADLEMRELQKEGKIGRIEVELDTNDSKTEGEIEIPSALDKAETTIIAAALETIERVGPTDAKIEILGIEDVRGGKREYILERAKKLLEQIEGKGPEIGEMESSVRESTRTERIQSYGKEGLPAGDISGKEIIVVEGRADVVNLLRYRVNNVIGMNGVNLPEEVKDLSKEKEVTLFIDGDRGGKLISKNVIDNARVAYVAVAPDGKEVEELTGKEILQCLRKRVPVEEFSKISRYSRAMDSRGYGERKYESRRYEEEPEEVLEEREVDDEIKEKLKGFLDEVGRGVWVLNENFDVVRKTSVMGLRRLRKAYAVVTEIAGGKLISELEEKGCKHVAARNFTSIPETKINLISL
ncbi:hypothetical protein COV15_01120 [Candidatus Woesearchaeota archaeon CG10_big_fil_rev_8_21_14_0_10_34_12]|nr:MAG: hypothetical protein COV15_01120 [Candidatus Woesearchaeota archaeon CG10_big_fil_rev_8_21_14_0_10_34_12]